MQELTELSEAWDSACDAMADAWPVEKLAAEAAKSLSLAVSNVRTAFLEEAAASDMSADRIQRVCERIDKYYAERKAWLAAWVREAPDRFRIVKELGRQTPFDFISS